MPDNLDDLRREGRVATGKSISVSFSNQQEGAEIQKHPCRSQDFSTGGLKILTHFSLPLGTIQSMTIDLGQSSGSITAKAEVRWCLEIDQTPTFSLGMKLIDLTKKDLDTWQKFVKSA